jgi:hypothetical protein
MNYKRSGRSSRLIGLQGPCWASVCKWVVSLDPGPSGAGRVSLQSCVVSLDPGPSGAGCVSLQLSVVSLDPGPFGVPDVSVCGRSYVVRTSDPYGS